MKRSIGENPSALPESHGEVLVEATFDTFSKRYFLDILFQGAIFELKAVE